MIGLEDRLELLQLPAHAAADLIAELEHRGVADRIARVIAVLGAADHAGSVKDSKMLGNVLLGGAERLLELADSGLALAQPVEQLDPHRLAEHAEALCHELD